MNEKNYPSSADEQWAEEHGECPALTDVLADAYDRAGPLGQSVEQDDLGKNEKEVR